VLHPANVGLSTGLNRGDRVYNWDARHSAIYVVGCNLMVDVLGWHTLGFIGRYTI